MLQQIIESPVKDRDDKYIDIGENTLFKDVIEVKRSLAGSLYRSNMTMVEITLKGYYDALNEWVRYTRVVGANGQEATIDYGSFLVLESNYNDDTEETKLVAYDRMILAQTEYRHEDIDLTFPTTIKAVFDRLLQVCGLETTTTSFENMNELVQEEVWRNTQYTYRDVLNHIAQVSGSIIGIKNDKLEVYYPSESDYTVQQKNLTSLKMGDDYGKINILNLTREPQHDNYAYAVYGGVEVVFSEIPVDERKELVFQNNPIVDKNREYWAPKIFPLIANTSYKTFTANTLSGYGIFDIGDIVEVEEYNTGLTHTALITDEHTTHRHMLVSEVKSDKPFDSKERYVVVTDERREGQQTYLLVDQLNGEIIAVVEDINDLEEITNELQISLEGIELKVSNINFGSIYVNSNGEFGNYFGWSFPNTNTPMYVFGGLYALSGMTQFTNFEIIEDNNSLAGSKISFFGNGRAVQSLVPVINDRIYSFKTTRVNGNQTLNIVVNEYDSDRNYIKNQTLPLPNNVPQEFTLSEFDSSTAFVSVEWQVSGVTLNDRLEFTETMFAIGQPKDYFVSSNNVRSWAESSITQLSDNIELKVNKDGVVSAINQTSETIKIDANKINLTGYVTFSNLTTEIDSTKTYADDKADTAQSNAKTYTDEQIVAIDEVLKTYTDDEISAFSGGLGDLAFEDKIGTALLDNTIIDGGYIKTNLISFNNAVGNNVNLTGEITATSGSIGNFDIQNGVMTQTSPVYSRNTQGQTNQGIRDYIMNPRTLSAYEMYIWDTDDSGVVNALDYMRIKDYLDGIAGKPKNPQIQSQVYLGNSTGQIISRVLFNNGQVGSETVIQADNITTGTVEVSGLSIGGRSVEVDSNGFLKLV